MEQGNPVEWKMRTRVLLCWTVTLAVAIALGLLAYYQTPAFSLLPDLSQLVIVGGLLALGACTVIGLVAWAVGASRTARRYGDAVFELETVPVALGGRLEGRIRAAATLAPDQALNLILQCEASDIGGGESGGSSWVAFESEQLLTSADVEQEGGELIVPVDLPVPGDQPPSETAVLGGFQVAVVRTQAEARWLAAELRRALGVEVPASS